MSFPSETQVTRPGVGTAGKKIAITVNAFKFAPSDRTVYHYDVSVRPDDVPASVRMDLFKYLQKEAKGFGRVAVVYDGRANLYSPTLLPFPGNSQTFRVILPEADGSTRTGANVRQFEVTVQITKAAGINLMMLSRFVKGHDGATAGPDVLTAIHALNVLVNHDVTLRHPSKKNKFFPAPRAGPEGANDVLQINRGIEIWRGFFSSVRLAPGAMVMNFDITSQPMSNAGDLMQIAAAIGGLRDPRGLMSMDPKTRIQVERGLKLIKVEVKLHGKVLYRKKVQGVTKESADKLMFDNNGKRMSVAEHFRTTHNYRLQYPGLPCVRLSKLACYPMEVCSIMPGQKYNRKLESDQLAKAIKWLTLRPADRMGLLREGLRRNFHPSVTTTINAWGVKIDPNPMTIMARELPNPALLMKAKRGAQFLDTKIMPRDGVWDMKDKAVHTPGGRIDHWMVVVFNRESNFFHSGNVEEAVNGLRKALGDFNIPTARPKMVLWAGRTREDLRPAQTVAAYLRDNWRSIPGPNPQLVVCIFDDKSAWQYPELKRFGDITTGTATQGLDTQKVKRGNLQYWANVALKINVKLGGKNQVLDTRDLFTQPTMVLGADVTHPSPDSHTPSIAAVVGSMHMDGTGYVPEFRIQPSRKEIIDELDNIVEKLARRFLEDNKRLPVHLLFYRDGVSEGQFATVLAEEVPLVRRGCYKVDPRWQYKLTFVICGKRHHFRFSPRNEREGDRNGNCKPGLIVDTDIVHPFDFDWYGQSHQGLLGTSRSSHYTVLVDDAHMSADQLQRLTYHLCFLYSRATRSVSIVTPAYYAHHVCTRAKLWCNEAHRDEDSGDANERQSQKDMMEANALGRYRQVASNLMANSAKWRTEFWM